MEKMRHAEEAIQEGKKRIGDLRKQAETRLSKMTDPSPEVRAEIAAAFPQVFPSKTDGHTA
jgi:hypothetical protein